MSEQRWIVGRTAHITVEVCPHEWGHCGSSPDENHACGRGADHQGPCRCRYCHQKHERTEARP